MIRSLQKWEYRIAFTDFKRISDVQQAYNIYYALKSGLFEPISFKPSPAFTTNFEQLSRHIDVYRSGQMRKQAIIWPMLSDVYFEYTDNLIIWAEEYISVLDDPTLSGAPDYFLSTRSLLGITVLGKPLIIIVEAKQDNFTQGWVQCLAAMVASQKLNEMFDIDVFGIVTTGQLWQFGRLRADLFEQDDHMLNREEAFGYINAIFAEADTLASRLTQRRKNSINLGINSVYPR